MGTQLVMQVFPDPEAMRLLEAVGDIAGAAGELGGYTLGILDALEQGLPITPNSARLMRKDVQALIDRIENLILGRKV